jgi:hypothetical protein
MMVPTPQRKLQDVGAESWHHHLMKLQSESQQYLDLVDGCNLKESKILLQAHHLKLEQLALKELQESPYAASDVNERLLIHHKSHNQPQIGGGEEITLARTSCGNLCAVYANNLNHNLLLPVRSSSQFQITLSGR